MRLIHTLLDEASLLHGENIAIEDPNSHLTYDQLNHRSRLVANALLDLNIKMGDRVAILSPNCADYLVLQYAVSRLGGILEVLNTRHVTDELSYALNNAEASCLFIHQDCIEHLQALESCPSIKFSIGLGKITDCKYNLNELLNKTSFSELSMSISNKTPAVLMFTSGTTGKPKGAIQNQENSVQADLITVKLLDIISKDRFLAFMPFFHQAGLIRARAILSQGATLVISGAVNIENIADYLLEKRITMTMLVPPYSGKLIDVCEEKNISLPDLRMLIGGTGGARFKEFCIKNACRSMMVYGQTEVTGLITAIFDKESWKRKGSVGQVVEDMEMEIWDEEGKPVKTGETGEIMAKSVRCISGYWNNQEASNSLYSKEWMHTGDLGRVDEDGFLYFINRKKELIKTGGENVYPIEVENVIVDHPNVKDAIVMGMLDKSWGEVVVSVLVTKNNQNLDIVDLKQFCVGKLAGYKIPKRVYCVKEIPRNHTGKPNKLLLQKLLG
jgi:fatty-acyl-CoA synthase